MVVTDEELEIALRVAAMLPKVKEQVAANLKTIRDKQGISQAAAAEQCNLCCKTFSRIENGLENFTIETLIGISLGMNVSIDELLGKYAEYKEKAE